MSNLRMLEQASAKPYQSFSDIENNPSQRGTRPIYIQKPHILGDIVEKTLELGRYDIAAESLGVHKKTCTDWIYDGKIQYEAATEADEDTIPLLAQFYLEIMQAKAIFLSGRLKKIIEKADSNDPEYKNFNLWIVENVDEERRFARWSTVNMKSEEKKEINITVTYADGRQWVSGGKEQDMVEGEVFDTTMKQIEAGTDMEDF